MTLKPIRESQFEQLTMFQLPTLPAGTLSLLKSLTDENIEFFELASIIELGELSSSGDILNLPQFNGYFKLATMSHKEYPNNETQKTV